jgi:hypothetical protein
LVEASNLYANQKDEEADKTWSSIIESSLLDEKMPLDMIEALHYDDRREFYKYLTDELQKIQNQRELVKQHKAEATEGSDW